MVTTAGGRHVLVEEERWDCSLPAGDHQTQLLLLQDGLALADMVHAHQDLADQLGEENLHEVIQPL